MAYQLGRQPNDPTKLRLRLDKYQVGSLVPPVSADWLNSVKSWPMSLNDSIGDCTAAGSVVAEPAEPARPRPGRGRRVDAPPSAPVVSVLQTVGRRRSARVRSSP